VKLIIILFVSLIIAFFAPGEKRKVKFMLDSSLAGDNESLRNAGRVAEDFLA
jgi:hypothetical protein